MAGDKNQAIFRKVDKKISILVIYERCLHKWPLKLSAIRELNHSFSFEKYIKRISF